MNSIQARAFSPKNTLNQPHLLKDKEVLVLINSLSSIIQSYFTLTKVSISDLRKYVPISHHSNIDSITLMIMSFINQSKDIFKKLKDIRNEINDNPLNSLKPSLNKSRNYSKPKLGRQTSPVKSITSFINFSVNGKNSLFSDSYNKNSYRSLEPNNKSNNTERALSLANAVIYFLSQIKQFKELILKKTGDIDEKKRQFDNVKNELMELAQDILTSTQQQDQVHQYQYQLRPQSKNKSNSHMHLKEYIRENNHYLSQSQKNAQANIKKINKINNSPTKLSLTPSNDAGLAQFNTMKMTIKNLQQKNSDLKQKNKDLSLFFSVNTGTNILLSKLREKEEEIKVLRRNSMKKSIFDKNKNSYNDLFMKNTNSNSNFNSKSIGLGNKDKCVSKSDQCEQYDKKGDKDRDKLRLSVQSQHNDDDYNKIITTNSNIEEDNMFYDSNGLNQEVNTKKRLSKDIEIDKDNTNKDKDRSRDKIKENEMIIARCKRYNSNVTFTFNNNSNSELQGSELIEKLNRQILELNNELIQKSKEIFNLTNENSDKNKEIASTIKEFHQIKSKLEIDNGCLTEELENKTKENELLINEVKVLNEQMKKINIPHKQNTIKNALEYKKLYDELFKERREKMELLNIKKNLNQAILKLHSELLMKNRGIDKVVKRYKKSNEQIENITLELKGKDIENKALKDEIDNYRVIQSKLLNNSSSVMSNNNANANAKEYIEELNGKDLVLEYINIKDEMLRYKSEKESLEKVNQALNKEILEKDSMIIHLKLHNRTDNDKSNENDKEAINVKLNRRSKSLEVNNELNNVDLKESIDIHYNDIIIKSKDNRNDLNELKHKYDIEKNNLIKGYETKINQLTSFIEKISKENEEHTTDLKAKLSLLQSDYDNQELILDQKRKEMVNLKASKSILNEEGFGLIKNFSSTQQQVGLCANISHETYLILCDKTYNNLHWYLMTPKANQSKTITQYDNTFWIEGVKIDNQLSKYNKFKTEREIEQETYDQMNTIQSRLLKKLEEKDDELLRIQNTIEKMKDKQSDFVTSHNDSLLNKGFNNYLLPSETLHYNNDSNFISMEKYERLRDELNDAKNKLAKSNSQLTKLINDNKELNKIVNERGVQIEPCLSVISRNSDAKDMLSFSDDNPLQNNILMDSESIQRNNEDNSTEKDKDKDRDKERDNDTTMQLKNIILLLMQEITFTKKIKRLLYEICKLIGFADEEALRMIVEKEKKGGLLGFFKKKLHD